LIEAYYGGSHRAWADAYKTYSKHEVVLLTMPAQFWKWRMQGSAVTLARLASERDLTADVILASDMIDLATFRALTMSRFGNTPTALFFHESQLTYPQNARQSHGWRYGFINYVSALAADRVYFNSPYHHRAFFDALPKMLKHFGDFNELETVNTIRDKSEILALGIDLSQFDTYRPNEYEYSTETPIILWNHRWDEDKNPGMFFQALYKLEAAGFEFRVAVTGENIRQNPEEFEEARQRLGSRVIAFGFMPDFSDYANLLWRSQYVVSTANQEFFGTSTAEAIYCRCTPILPNRLNYPNLIPEQFHQDYLYRNGTLYHLLARHLTGEITFETQPLQEFISQFDWQHMAPIYDDRLSDLVRH
jgi:glycosyltransferase involved in cell wall biosynthesis